MRARDALLKGAFLGTEAASALVLYVTKVMTFSGLGALPLDVAIKGLIVGSALTIGTFVGKIFVSHCLLVLIENAYLPHTRAGVKRRVRQY